MLHVSTWLVLILHVAVYMVGMETAPTASVSYKIYGHKYAACVHLTGANCTTWISGRMTCIYGVALVSVSLSKVINSVWPLSSLYSDCDCRALAMLHSHCHSQDVPGSFFSCS